MNGLIDRYQRLNWLKPWDSNLDWILKNREKWHQNNYNTHFVHTFELHSCLSWTGIGRTRGWPLVRQLVALIVETKIISHLTGGMCAITSATLTASSRQTPTPYIIVYDVPFNEVSIDWLIFSRQLFRITIRLRNVSITKRWEDIRYVRLHEWSRSGRRWKSCSMNWSDSGSATLGWCRC